VTGILATQPEWWTRDDWLDWRRQGIGASDVAAICGLSRFGSPMSVFVDKCELGAPRTETKPMKWGQLHEPMLARAFEEETGLHVLHPQTLVVDETVSWRRCTLDGLVAESADVSLADHEAFLGLCEIKCSSDFGWDDLPDEYKVQIQWQMGVAGFERCWVPVLHQGNNDRIYGPYDFEPRSFAALCSIVDRFYTEHIATQSPPPADGSDATTEALKAAFSEGLGEPVELDDALLDIARQWPAAKQRVKEAEAEVDRIENELRAALGDHAIGGPRVDGDIVPIVTWKPQTTARIDTKALRAAHPSIAEEFSTSTISRVLRPTKALKELVEEGAPA